jgi:cytochrome c oxidase subunit 2
MQIKSIIFFFINIILFHNNAFALENWQMTFQEPVTDVMRQTVDLHNYMMIYMTLIVLVVLGLLIYVCVRFNEKANPVPDKFTHNVTIEVIWTVVPIIIIILVGAPALSFLRESFEPKNVDMTIKVVGHQWYWSYEYPDHGNFGFDSNIVKDEDIKEGQYRLLEVDNPIVMPVDTTVKFLVTAADVIHDFAVPQFAIKTDAVPGRINHAWAKVNKIGTYYGQCSELCGVNHGFMPIKIHVVSKEDFESWINSSKKKFSAS